MSFSSSTTTMDSVRRLFGFEMSDGNGTTRCRLNVKVNLNTILCVLAVFLIGLLFGYIFFHGSSNESAEKNSNAVKTSLSESPTFSPFLQPTPPPSESSSLSKQEMNRRKSFIRRMAQNAWKAYARFAWKEMSLKPVSKTAYTGEEDTRYTKGLTLVQSLSTLWLMNLTAEYEYGRAWVQMLNFTDIKSELVLRFAIPRYLGSMLAIHALTGDSMYLEKIHQLETIIEPAFSRANGLPYNTLEPAELRARGDSNYLATAGAFHLELGYLDDFPNSTTFWRVHLTKNRRTLASIANVTTDGLYMQSIEAADGAWNSQVASLQEHAAPYYASLLHSYLRSNRTDKEAIRLYREAVQAAERASLITKASKDGQIYTRDLTTPSRLPHLSYSHYNQDDRYEGYMHYEGCGLAGMLALGADALEDQLAGSLSPVERRREMYEIYAAWRQAEGLAETCHSAAAKTLTGLTPSQISFEDGSMAKTDSENSHGYITPPLVSSYFTLYRLTGEKKWRDYAWELAHSIEYHCHIANSGYSNLKYVEKADSFDDLQPDDFIGGTLKFLYLTFADPDDANYLPLHQWVFNAVGQPIPICGRNKQYPKVNQCK